MDKAELIAATALANQDYRGPSWHAEPLERAAVVCAPGWALAESYRKDAERYRWLRDSADGPFVADWFNGNAADIRQLTGAIADAAIDAALGTHVAGAPIIPPNRRDTNEH